MVEAKDNFPESRDRQDKLTRLRNLKMAESSHRFVRGSTEQFYLWLQSSKAGVVPTGPPVWICGDCHVGNLGPIANAQGRVEIQIRDLDHTVIGNPAHDLLRLALSLASSARGSDLPGVTTFSMMESMMEGYELAFAPDFDAEADLEIPPSILSALRASIRASWKTLARHRIADETPKIPLGQKFWALDENERKDIDAACRSGEVHSLATMLKSRPTEGKVKSVDAAYWVKGCSSLGKLRYAAVLSVAGKKKKNRSFSLMDFKEAVDAVAPHAEGAMMPKDNAERVIEGARHLSPYLGKRMAKTVISGRSVFVRELTPQDLQLELNQLDAGEATKVSAYLAAVVGKGHSRQMNPDQRRDWLADLKTRRSVDLDAPVWLWRTVVDLLGFHEKAYLQHCRQYALAGEQKS